MTSGSHGATWARSQCRRKIRKDRSPPGATAARTSQARALTHDREPTAAPRERCRRREGRVEVTQSRYLPTLGKRDSSKAPVLSASGAQVRLLRTTSALGHPVAADKPCSGLPASLSAGRRKRGSTGERVLQTSVDCVVQCSLLIIKASKACMSIPDERQDLVHARKAIMEETYFDNKKMAFTNGKGLERTQGLGEAAA